MLAAAGALLVALPGAAIAQGNPTIRSLAEALAMAEQGSPQKNAWAATVFAAQADVEQARLLPNPELSIAAENFAGSGDYAAGRSVELSVGVSQPIELGGKRAARVEVAERGVAVAQAETELRRLDLRQQVAEAFVDATAAARAVELERDRVALAADIAGAAQERYSAGKEPQIQADKAGLAKAAAAAALQRAQRDFAAARKRLAALLGQEEIDFVVDRSWFEDIGAAPAPGAEAGQGRGELALLQAELAQKQAEIESLRADAVPNMVLGAGVTRFADTDDTAFLASVSIPLPVFNRNQGAVLRARHEVEQIQARTAAARLTLAADLVGAREGFAAAWTEADTLKRQILPGAERAFATAREGYRAGKFTYLDVLDAQRTLTDAREQFNQALRAIHVRRAQLDRLTAASGR